MSGSGFVPCRGLLAPLIGSTTGYGHPALDADRHWVAAGGFGVLAHLGDLGLSFAVWLKLGEPAIAHSANAAHHLIGAAAEPDGDGPLYRQRIDAGMTYLVVAALEVDHLLCPESAHQPYLLHAAAAPVGEILAKGLILHVVPTDADAQSQAPAG